MLEEITPLIITWDEAPNIRRTLGKLLWARRIVVIDSGSTDGTLELLRSYPQVAVIDRQFDGFAGQCNFGLQQVRTPWVLSLDADYELSTELLDEIAALRADEATAGYRARFVYRIFGRPLRASLYPPRVVLYRCNRATYVNEGHGHRVTVSGKVQSLKGAIYHDDRKPLSRWFTSQRHYAAKEADYLLSRGPKQMRGLDRIRRTGWLAPMIVFFYTLVVKRCLFDGWPGWYYVLQRVIAESMIALEIVERRLRRNG